MSTVYLVDVCTHCIIGETQGEKCLNRYDLHIRYMEISIFIVSLIWHWRLLRRFLHAFRCSLGIGIRLCTGQRFFIGCPS